MISQGSDARLSQGQAVYQAQADFLDKKLRELEQLVIFNRSAQSSPSLAHLTVPNLVPVGFWLTVSSRTVIEGTI